MIEATSEGDKLSSIYDSCILITVIVSLIPASIITAGYMEELTKDNDK